MRGWRAEGARLVPLFVLLIGVATSVPQAGVVSHVHHGGAHAHVHDDLDAALQHEDDAQPSAATAVPRPADGGAGRAFDHARPGSERHLHAASPYHRVLPPAIPGPAWIRTVAAWRPARQWWHPGCAVAVLHARGPPART